MTAPQRLVAGRYRLGELLGVGGMGRVWLARDETLGREVAIKEIVPPAELAALERAADRRRSLREARAAARLSHPNVVRIYDVLEADDRPWIVMEYVPSRSLQQVIDADGPLEPRRVAAIGLEVLTALEAAHRAGVLHRDVKPANVLLASDGRVMLTDFGIATFEGDGFMTGSGPVLGSPEYISPERARDGTAGPAADLWSLGATLYAAVEGRSPFRRPSSVETLTALADGAPDPARRAGVLRPVLAGLLRSDPAERIDLATTRRRLLAATGQAPDRRRRRPLIVSAAAILAVVAVTWWTVTRPDAAGSVWHSSGVTAPATTAAEAAESSPPPTVTGDASARPTGPGADGGSGGGSGGGAVVVSEPAPGGRRPALPAGWRDHHDPTGFSVYVPIGWTESREGSIVYFRDPATGRVLGIDQTDRPKPDPVADWRGQASYRVARGDFPAYREVRIAAVPYWTKAADWEFTFDGRTRQHVDNRGFITSPSKAYGIWWQTSDASWAAARPDLQLIFDSFRPTQP